MLKRNTQKRIIYVIYSMKATITQKLHVTFQKH